MINNQDTCLPYTQPPFGTKTTYINAAETMLPFENPKSTGVGTDMTAVADNDRVEEKTLQVGTYIADKYRIAEIMQHHGKQSQIYKVIYADEEYALKLYHSGWQPSSELRAYMLRSHHPNLANCVDIGSYRGQYYEVFPYYQHGTLRDKGKCEENYLAQMVVPSLNEGLHELHTNGIIHCDIKPDNLFCEPDRIIIGDYGLCGYTNSDGKMIDLVRGTPEYSPPVFAIYNTAIYQAAYDYGALGLVLFQLATGHSMLSNMSHEEIVLAWNKGLVIPSTLGYRMTTLLKGLLNNDEEARWGYEEVKQWCDQGFSYDMGKDHIKSRNETAVKKGLVFGRTNGTTVVVHTLHELANAIRADWKQAGIVVKRRDLTDFLKQFDQEMALEVNKLARMNNEDEAVFYLLYSVENTNHIVYKGNDYGTLTDCLNVMDDAPDEERIRFLKSNMLLFFLEKRGVQKQTIEEIHKIQHFLDNGEYHAFKNLCLSAASSRILRIQGQEIRSISDFIGVLAKNSTAEIDRLMDHDDTIAWLYSMGFGERVFSLKAPSEERISKNMLQ